MKKSRKILYLAGILVLALGAVYFLQPFRFRMVWGDSMYPTLKSGSAVWVDTGFYRENPIRTGDVVLLRHDGETFVKRVVAVPGDELLLFRSKDASAVLIPLWRVVPALELSQNSAESRLERLIVEENQFYVVGDNRIASFDSRDFGAVPRAEIKGRVLLEEH